MGWDGTERRSERRIHPMHCLHEHEWGEIQQYIKNQEERSITTTQFIQKVESAMMKHIDEGERAGGIRDRVKVVEIKVADIENIKRGVWKAGIIGGVIGSLFAQAAPEVMKLLIGIIFK